MTCNNEQMEEEKGTEHRKEEIFWQEMVEESFDPLQAVACMMG